MLVLCQAHSQNRAINHVIFPMLLVNLHSKYHKCFVANKLNYSLLWSYKLHAPNYSQKIARYLQMLTHSTTRKSIQIHNTKQISKTISTDFKTVFKALRFQPQ